MTCASLTFKVGKSRRPLTDTERDMVADAIMDHIKLCNWKVEGGRHGADLRISQEDRSRTGETQSGCKATPDYIGPTCGRFTYRLTWPELARKPRSWPGHEQCREHPRSHRARSGAKAYSDSILV